MKVGSNSFSYLLLITIPVLVLVLANLTALSGQSLLTMKRFVSPRSKAKNKASEAALATPTIITGPHAHETTPTNGNHQLQPDRLLVHRQRHSEHLVDNPTNDNNYQLQPDRLADALLAAAPMNKVQTRQQPERLVNASPKLNGKFVRR